MRDALQGPALHRAIARVVARHLDPRAHRVWIVGSEATGTALPGSDVDVALEGPAPVDLERLARLRSDLDMLPTLRSFDLVDLRRTSEGFRREALRVAIPLELSASG